MLSGGNQTHPQRKSHRMGTGKYLLISALLVVACTVSRSTCDSSVSVCAVYFDAAQAVRSTPTSGIANVATELEGLARRSC